MPIHVHATCEAPSCTTACAFAFEYSIETFAHLIEALQGDGWIVIVSDSASDSQGADLTRALGVQRRTHTFCPTHGAQLAPPVAVALELGAEGAPVQPVAFELEGGQTVDIPEAARLAAQLRGDAVRVEVDPELWTADFPDDPEKGTPCP